MWTLLRPRLSSHVLEPILGWNPNNRYVDFFQSSFKIPFEVFYMKDRQFYVYNFETSFDISFVRNYFRGEERR
jgi:hypothetical protein